MVRSVIGGKNAATRECGAGYTNGVDEGVKDSGMRCVQNLVIANRVLLGVSDQDQARLHSVKSNNCVKRVV